MVSAFRTPCLSASLIPHSADSLRFYYLGDKYQTRIEHFGSNSGYEPEGVLMV